MATPLYMTLACPIKLSPVWLNYFCPRRSDLRNGKAKCFSQNFGRATCLHTHNIDGQLQDRLFNQPVGLLMNLLYNASSKSTFRTPLEIYTALVRAEVRNLVEQTDFGSSLQPAEASCSSNQVVANFVEGSPIACKTLRCACSVKR